MNSEICPILALTEWSEVLVDSEMGQHRILPLPSVEIRGYTGKAELIMIQLPSGMFRYSVRTYVVNSKGVRMGNSIASESISGWLAFDELSCDRRLGLGIYISNILFEDSISELKKFTDEMSKISRVTKARSQKTKC